MKPRLAIRFWTLLLVSLPTFGVGVGLSCSENSRMAGAGSTGGAGSGGTMIGGSGGTTMAAGGRIDAGGAGERQGGAGATGGEKVTDAGLAVDALPDGACLRRADCPPDSIETWICLSPFEQLPPSGGGTGGAPGGSNITPPPGAGTTCQSPSQCANAADGGTSAALVCADGLCQQCGTDSDCPTSSPICFVLARYPNRRVCGQCREDAQCPRDRPTCLRGVDTAGLCKACFFTGDCAQGECVKNECIPTCSSNADCPDPARPCSSRNRCEAKRCTTDVDCPLHTSCASGICFRIPCASSSDCTNGACVDNRCYETNGTCRHYYQGQ